MQNWIASLKQACPRVIDHAASDQLWTQFRKWVHAETFKLQDLNYEQAQQNFSNLLKEVEGPVLSQLLKEEVLHLDSEPWSEKRPASTVQPAEEQTIPAEDISQEEVVSESS